jgi:hypothetical protein
MNNGFGLMFTDFEHEITQEDYDRDQAAFLEAAKADLGATD